jgi:hypothetical protein
MTLSDGEKEGLTAMEDGALIGAWDSFKDAEDLNKKGRQYVEYLLLRRMEERGADAVPAKGHDIKLSHPYDTDPDRLTPLAELLDPATIAAGYTPPEQVWTPPKWNMTVVNSWRKFGTTIADIIDGAKLPQPARLSIKRKAVRP